jgi:nicotinamide mononucleotide transporter
MLDLSSISYAELASCSIALLALLLNVKKSVWGWPLNILKKGFGLIAFFQKELYIKSGVDLILILSSLYAWQQWHMDKKKKTVDKVTRLPLHLSFLLFAASIFSGLLLGYIARARYPSTSFPYLDGLHATTILLTYRLLAKKKLEAWPLFIFSTLIHFPPCWQKGLYLFVLKYIGYVGIGIYGFFRWYADYKRSKLYQPL